MDSNKTKHLRALLAAEKERLERELASIATKDPAMAGDWDTAFPITAASPAPLSHSSQEEQADIREEYEAEIAQEQSLESRLGEVNRALERIASGTFGRCRTCSQPIPEARLLANPAAEYDMEHQPRE